MKTTFFVLSASIVLISNFAQAENRALIIGVGKYRIETASLPGIEQHADNMVKAAHSIGFSDNRVCYSQEQDQSK